jgi:hypothetical protein
MPTSYKGAAIETCNLAQSLAVGLQAPTSTPGNFTVPSTCVPQVRTVQLPEGQGVCLDTQETTHNNNSSRYAGQEAVCNRQPHLFFNRVKPRT